MIGEEIVLGRTQNAGFAKIEGQDRLFRMTHPVYHRSIRQNHGDNGNPMNQIPFCISKSYLTVKTWSTINLLIFNSGETNGKN
jgi:hypothetical protein